MKKLRTLLLATVLFTLGFTVSPKPANYEPWSDLSCEDIVELDGEMEIIYHIATDRFGKVQGEYSKRLWMELKIFTLQNHDTLLHAQGQKCKEA